MLQPLVITVSEIGSTRAVRIAGEIDMATSPQLAEMLEQCIGAPVCVDLGDVTFIDSSGLAVLARAHQRANDESVEFTIANATANVVKLLTITGLESLLAAEQK